MINFKMNKIINKVLLIGDKFIPELHLKHLLLIVKPFKILKKQVI